MRGKARKTRAAAAYLRITPAYAGKSRTVCGIRSKLEDHPRLCGEKLDAVTVLISTLGSPPPMRGKAVSGQSPPTRYRITPAYAGKSSAACCASDLDRDHPRLCGEKPVGKLFSGKKTGSPPPMRGKGEGIRSPLWL